MDWPRVRRWALVILATAGMISGPALLLQDHEEAHMAVAKRHGVESRQTSPSSVELLGRPETKAQFYDIYVAGYRSTMTAGILIAIVAGVLPVVWPAAGFGLGIALRAFIDARYSYDWSSIGGFGPSWWIGGVWYLILPVAIVAFRLWRDKLMADEAAGKPRPKWLQ